MQPLSIIFYKGKPTFFDRPIRWWTRSPYSHCAFSFNGRVDGRDLIIEAVQGAGVRQWVVDVPLDPHSWDRVNIHLPDPLDGEDLYQWCLREIGCRYDWSGLIWAQILQIPREHPDKWFCSEFCAAGLQRVNALAGDEPCAYSPGSLARALHPTTP